MGESHSPTFDASCLTRKIRCQMKSQLNSQAGRKRPFHITNHRSDQLRCPLAERFISVPSRDFFGLKKKKSGPNRTYKPRLFFFLSQLELHVTGNEAPPCNLLQYGCELTRRCHYLEKQSNAPCTRLRLSTHFN